LGAPSIIKETTTKKRVHFVRKKVSRCIEENKRISKSFSLQPSSSPVTFISHQTLKFGFHKPKTGHLVFIKGRNISEFLVSNGFKTGNHAAVKHQKTSFNAKAFLEDCQQIFYRGNILGIAWHHPPVKRVAIRRDHQGDSDLKSVRPMVAGITMSNQNAFCPFKIAEGDIVKDSLFIRVKVKDIFTIRKKIFFISLNWCVINLQNVIDGEDGDYLSCGKRLKKLKNLDRIKV